MNHSLYQDGILKALPFKRLPWVQRIALNLIRHRPSGKDSLTVKRKKAGWSIAYLIETIAAVPA